jgi:hypothetical protein
LFTIVQGELIDERRFAGTRRARHTDEMCLAGVGEEFSQRNTAIRRIVFNLG